jgi:formylglycine-generating enzyme required for sulfatase activity
MSTTSQDDRVTGTAPFPDMAEVPSATFLMGSNDHYPEERPVHRVAVDGFWIDQCEVTNRQFAAFVEATGYATIAERPLDPADFPGAPAAN